MATASSGVLAVDRQGAATTRVEPGALRLPSYVARIINAPPQSGRIGVTRMTDTMASGRYDTLVVIPASNEEEYLPAAIHRVVRSAAEASAGSWALIVIVNNSDDVTYDIAKKQLHKLGCPALLLECAFDPSIADIGHVRRFALDLAAALPGARYLLSTDADGEVGIDWVERAIASLRHSEMVCGKVATNGADLASLPASVTICGDVETDLRSALDSLWYALNGPSARGFSNMGLGANMAVRARSYIAAGGLPPVPSGEDRALHALFARQGRSIEHDSAMIVTVSGRTCSRVQGGMAACLAARARDRDPFVDSQLWPAYSFLKHALWQRDRGGPAEFALNPDPLRVSQARVEARLARKLAATIRSGTAPSTLLRATGLPTDRDTC